MKLTAIIVLAALLGAGLVWQFIANRATQVEVDRWSGRLEDQEDSTHAWRNRAQASEAANLRLGALAVRLNRDLGLSQEANTAAIGTLRALARDRQHPQPALNVAADVFEAGERVCTAVAANCTERVASESTLAADATRQVEALLALNDTTAQKWHAAERANSSGFLGLRLAWKAKAQLGAVALLVLLLK